MDSPSLDFLKSIWSGANLEQPKRWHCGTTIEPEETLARTFILESEKPKNERRSSERIDVPNLSEALLVYHRHLDCLFRSTLYVAISHVWHPGVAELQYNKTCTTTNEVEVAQVVRELPIQIYLGVAKIIPEPFEIWHDYISVPQWQYARKTRIIQSIPSIYNRAHQTIAHLSDVDAENIIAMPEGTSIYEKCRGVSQICNAKWFSRVWTAMEYTKSRELKTMLKDFTLLDDHDAPRPLINELVQTWGQQAALQGNAFQNEAMVGMGSNLVPWQLGPSEALRAQNLKGIRTTFGMAHELLALRGVTNRRDFFHAMLGLLKTSIAEPELDADEQKAMLQVARSCINEGDFSPLLMIPASAQLGPEEANMRSYGYLDLYTFALGFEQKFPKFPNVTFTHAGNPQVQLENIGLVKSAKRLRKRLYGLQGDIGSFSFIIREVVHCTGLDVTAFVETIARLYGQKPEGVIKRLETYDQRCEILEKLKLAKEYNLASEDSVTWIAESLGISDISLNNPMSNLSPRAFLNAHGCSLHLDDSAALVAISCYACKREFLIRVALLRSEIHVVGTTAYRIPGLKYEFTHEGGAGLLLKDGRAVGRFLWGTPTCECDKLGMLRSCLMICRCRWLTCSIMGIL